MSIPVIVVTEQKHTLELLKLYLEEFEAFNFLDDTSDFTKAYNGVKELDKSLVIVDISEYPEQGLNFVSKISSEFKNCKVIALSDKPAVDMVIRAMRIGASDFLSLPLIKGEFFEVLDKTYNDLTDFTIDVENPKIKIQEAKVTYINGYIKGTILNNTNEEIRKSIFEI